jgi:hypothetical protein
MFDTLPLAGESTIVSGPIVRPATSSEGETMRVWKP